MVINLAWSDMKKYIYLIFLSCLGWIGCSNDDNGNFDVEIDENMFSFIPTEGGAIMHYSLADRRINKVKAEYTDEYGASVYKVAEASIPA